MSGRDRKRSAGCTGPSQQLGLFDPVPAAPVAAAPTPVTKAALQVKPLVTADRSPRFEGRRFEGPTFERRLIMLLDMDAFFASAEQAARPELKGRPVIVGGLATDRSVVASASYEARALGVKTAMPIAQAQRICPQGVFLRGNYPLYAALSKKVIEICKTFTPLVQQASIDEAYMDLAGTERLYATAGARGQGSWASNGNGDRPPKGAEDAKKETATATQAPPATATYKAAQQQRQQSDSLGPGDPGLASWAIACRPYGTGSSPWLAAGEEGVCCSGSNNDQGPAGGTMAPDAVLRRENMASGGSDNDHGSGAGPVPFAMHAPLPEQAVQGSNCVSREEGVAPGASISQTTARTATTATDTTATAKLDSEVRKDDDRADGTGGPDSEPGIPRDSYARPMEARNWPVAVAERLLRAIREQTGLGGTIGIGSNKLVARMAMERAKPSGVCYVWPEYEAAFMATCPLGDIPGIGRQTAKMLADYNLRTAADVQKTDKELLVATFGERFGQVLHEAAWGRGESHLEMEYEQKSVSRDTSFERDTTDMEYIRSMLYYLTERACRTVRQMGQAAWTVSVKLRYSDFATVGKSQTLAEPSNHDDVVYGVAKELLEKLYTRAVSVRLVGVHLSGLVSAEQMQFQIWEQQQVRHGRLYETSDRIRERFGFCALMKGPSIELMGKMERDAAGLKLRTSCLTK